ncbi:hypothetical protein STENM223S_09775 [Streptomyces tendae]
MVSGPRPLLPVTVPRQRTDSPAVTGTLDAVPAPAAPVESRAASGALP